MYTNFMPSKNALKEYEAGAYYHIYNRGVAKCTIFKTDKDYKTFLSYLKLYLTPPPLRGLSPLLSPSRRLNNFTDQIKLISYCLMPNHFHLLVRQTETDSINYFMRSIATKYVRYFNQHYQRVGHLFQGRYKAVRVANREQFIYLTKYIHRNPLSLSTYEDSPRRLFGYAYSSYPNYLGKFSQDWVKTSEILSYFSQTYPHSNYQSFVEESLPDDISPITNVTLDLE